MILPIVAYGAAVLRKVGADITPDYPRLEQLIADMWETMYASNGVGLAAPQINKDIRLFVMDSAQIFEHLEEEENTAMPPVSKRYSSTHISKNLMGTSGRTTKDA